MSKLRLDTLQVTSFQTTEADAAAAGVETQNDPLCYSPWCGPTEGTNCKTEGTA
jgi:hypothetical protein